MTVELDRIINNLNGQEIHIELFNEGGKPQIYIGTDSLNGWVYSINSIDEVCEVIKFYLNNYYVDKQ